MVQREHKRMQNVNISSILDSLARGRLVITMG